jgi:cyclophilin family peptidyl-prolyl cis-trans isomerase
MRKFFILCLALIVLIALLAGACSSTAETPTPTPTPVHTPTPITTPSPAPTIKQWSAPPPMLIGTSKNYTAIMVTSKGNITLELFAKEDPLTVNNFVFLARQGFYNGVKFHRIIKGFVIQGGDPTDTGLGGPGYTFNDEPVTRDYIAGTLAMANSGPNTNGSQFFITLGNLTGQLEKKYTIFGLVTSGFDVVQAIGNVPVEANPITGELSWPVTDVYIISISIEEK